ncbi:hypothetical protein Tco_0282264 [Tanacetum coccineum]
MDGWNPVNKDGSKNWNERSKKRLKALVTVAERCVVGQTHSEDDENFALWLAQLFKIRHTEQLSDAKVEIKAYTQGLKKVEAQLVAHQQGQLWYEQKIKFMKIDLDDKTDVLTYHKKLLAKAPNKGKDDCRKDNPHRTLKNKGIIDSGCSRHMTGNKAYLADFQDF